MRHLPPVAPPLSWNHWRQGWRRSQPAIHPFRLALANYLGTRPPFLAASGRAALYALLRALKEEHPGRPQVILPAYACPALVPAIQQAGLQPRLIDVNPRTLDFNAGEVRAALGEQVLAVLYVHPFGLPQPIHLILRMAQAAGVVVIEDAAQALGSRLKSRPVGTWGDFGLFSLGPGKPLSTGGGGVLCANSPAGQSLLAQAWEHLSAPIRPQASLSLLRLAAMRVLLSPRGWALASHLRLQRYGNSEMGRRFGKRTLTAPQARVGLAQLGRLDAINGARRQRAESLLVALDDCPDLLFPALPLGAAPIYLRLPLLAPDEATRDRLVAALHAAGLGAGRMYEKSLPQLFPALRQGDYPGAAAVAGRLLTLPTHHYLTPADIVRIASVIQSNL